MEFIALIIIIILLIITCILGLINYLKKPSDNKDVLEKGFNQMVITIIEKNNEDALKTQNYILSSNKELSQNVTGLFNDLKENLVSKINSENQKSQDNILNILNKTTLNLLEQSKIELDKISKSNTESINGLITLSKSKLDQINQEVQTRLDENFARSLKSFEDITKNLGQIEQKAQRMIDSTKSVDKLNAIFGRTSSKAFGTFAESYLESVLKEHLDPQSYKSQVSIEGEVEKIDFVIYFGDKKIGIDAKFPLTKYSDFTNEEDPIIKIQKRSEYIRAVKEMAKDISKKYLKNHYLDNLLLYLPSDSMYLECLEEGDKFMDFMSKLKVSLISPNTLFPQIVLLQNYQTQIKISNSAGVIIKGLSNIRKNLTSFKNEYDKLGDKLRQAQNNFDSASRSLDHVDRNIKALESTDDGAIKTETIELL